MRKHLEMAVSAGQAESLWRPRALRVEIPSGGQHASGECAA